MQRSLAYERARRKEFLRKNAPVYTEDNNLSPPRALVGESILVNLHNKGTGIEHPQHAFVIDIKKKFPGRTRRHLLRYEDGSQEWLKLKRPYNKYGVEYELLNDLGSGKYHSTQRKRRRRHHGTRKPRRRRHHGTKKQRNIVVPQNIVVNFILFWTALVISWVYTGTLFW